jgi:hypothetical protein
MNRVVLLGFAVASSLASFLPQATAQAEKPDEKATSEAHDYKVAYWFERKNPLFTVQLKIYDVTRGEYTRAVDDWLATMKANYPQYDAFVREYRHVTRHQLGEKVSQDLRIIGGPNLGHGLRDTYGLFGPAGRPRRFTQAGPGLPSSGTSSAMRRPPGSPSPSYRPPSYPTSSPFPVPYPRPFR